ncbi:MAG: hypothetical protein HY553_11485 [Elusimicrobia bacterium]|nr:hypothetical protein [Elusimicrobiota bacterium]
MNRNLPLLLVLVALSSACIKSGSSVVVGQLQPIDGSLVGVWDENGDRHEVSSRKGSAYQIDSTYQDGQTKRLYAVRTRIRSSAQEFDLLWIGYVHGSPEGRWWPAEYRVEGGRLELSLLSGTGLTRYPETEREFAAYLERFRGAADFLDAPRLFAAIPGMSPQKPKKGPPTGNKKLGE